MSGADSRAAGTMRCGKCRLACYNGKTGASMLSAKRKSDGQVVTAYFESKRNAPFACLQCGEEVALKTGRNRVNHFAHVNPIACRYAEGESDTHRRCKMEIYEALRSEPGVRNVVLERPLGTVRPDISAEINGVPVAIEVQISSLSLETILHRTIEYFRKGIYVLWLLQWTPALNANRYAAAFLAGSPSIRLQWTPALNANRYTPRLWEKWIHAAYFGRVYYWTHGLTVACYHFEPSLKAVPRKSWYSASGKKMTAGGYSRRLKRQRTAVASGTFNLATDFVPRQRLWWEGNGIKVPDAKLYMDGSQRFGRDAGV